MEHTPVNTDIHTNVFAELRPTITVAEAFPADVLGRSKGLLDEKALVAGGTARSAETREKNKFDISRIVFLLHKDGCSPADRGGKFRQSKETCVMGSFTSHRAIVISGAAALFIAGAAQVFAQNAAPIPDFQTGNAAWVVANRDGLAAPPSGFGPTRADPAHPYIPNATFRIADTASPNLKPWAAEAMRKSNNEVLAGKYPFTARSSCMPAGVPGFSSFVVEPVFFAQSPKEVLITYSGDQQVRRVWMNVPHTANPKPSGTENRWATMRATRWWSIPLDSTTAPFSTITARRTRRSCTSSNVTG
jgi:hypothetical protein